MKITIDPAHPVDSAFAEFLREDEKTRLPAQRADIYAAAATEAAARAQLLAQAALTNAAAAAATEAAEAAAAIEIAAAPCADLEIVRSRAYAAAYPAALQAAHQSTAHTIQAAARTAAEIAADFATDIAGIAEAGERAARARADEFCAGDDDARPRCIRAAALVFAAYEACAEEEDEGICARVERADRSVRDTLAVVGANDSQFSPPEPAPGRTSRRKAPA